MRQKIFTGLVAAVSFFTMGLLNAPSANAVDWDTCNLAWFDIIGSTHIKDRIVFGSGSTTPECQAYIDHFDTKILSNNSLNSMQFNFVISGNRVGNSSTCNVSVYVNDHPWMQGVTHFEAGDPGAQNWYLPLLTQNEKSTFKSLLDLGDNVVSVSYNCGNLSNIGTTLSAHVRMAEESFDMFNGVSINDGAEFTNSRKVNINLSFDSGVVGEFMISNDGGFSRTQRKIYTYQQNTVSWTLNASQDERMSKTIYVKYRMIDPYSGALSSTWSQTMSDDIILDTVAPVVSQVVAKSSFSLLPTMNFTRDLRTSASRSIKLSLKASDNRSGVKKVQISGAKSSTDAITQIYAKYITVKNLGSKKHIYVRVRDGAGNWSSWKSVKVS